MEALRRLSDWSIMDFEDNLSYANQITEEAAKAIEALSKELMDLKMLTCCCCEPPKEKV